MFCSNCGNKVEDNAKFCSSCGTVISMSNQSKNQQSNEAQPGEIKPTHHAVPKCTYCGNIEEWQVGPLFRTKDYILGVAFLFLGVVPGLIYLGVVGFIRFNKDNREKICKKCGAKNMFTNIY